MSLPSCNNPASIGSCPPPPPGDPLRLAESPALRPCQHRLW
ncbi:MAG: hypothetical protein ACKO8I_05210 [Cyanobacteriota bacterium]